MSGDHVSHHIDLRMFKQLQTNDDSYRNIYQYQYTPDTLRERVKRPEPRDPRGIDIPPPPQQRKIRS
jgi:hypothetical protein